MTDRRVAEAAEFEARAAELKEQADDALARARRWDAAARKLRGEIRRDELIADPIICRDHGETCMVDDQGAMSTGYLYHVIIANGKVTKTGSTCSGPSVGRRSSFAPGELEAYRKRVLRG